MTADSEIDVTNSGINNQLFIDGAFSGAGDTLTINNTGSATAGVHFRNNTGTNFFGDVIVNGGQIAIGTNANPVLAGADLTLNAATLHLGSSAFAITGTGATIGSLSGDAASTVTSAGSTTTLTLGSNDGSGTFGGVIEDGAGGKLSLTKTGTGAQILSGTNTYTGLTNVNAGELIVNGTHTGAGDYNVASGARLGGDGSITLASGNIVTISDSPGAISPGDAGYVPAVTPPSGSHAPSFSYSAGLDPNTVGTFAVNSDLNLGGFLLIDLIDPTFADLLNVDGTVTLNDSTSMIEINGLTDLTQLNLAALDFDVGNRIDLLMADDIVGNFENFPLNQTVNGIFFENDGQSIFLQQVPEPAGAILWIGLGIFAMVALRLRISKR